MATTLPLDDAARRLGVHPATLRRRLHKGLARGVKQATPQGYVWLVELEEDAAHVQVDGVQADGYAAPAQAGLAQEVARLSAHVEDLRDTVRAREREVQELHVTINRLLLALPAPAPQTQSAPPARDPAGRSWWRRLWGGYAPA